MHRTIFKFPRLFVAESFSGTLLPIRAKQSGPFLVGSYQTVSGSRDLLAYGSRRNPIAKSFGLQVVTALQLGHKRQASDLLSEADVADHALNAEDIIYILEYCARTPDPLFVMETWRVLEGKNIALSWKCYMLITRALCNGGYLEEALQLVNFVRENNHMSFILPLYNCFLRACIKMKDMVLVNQCLDLMELQCSGKNEVTYTSLLKLAVRQENLSAVHEIWREYCKYYNMNIISLRKFIWSFTRLKDLKSALQTLHHMVDLAKERTSVCKTVEGKFYCPQLDIPIPSISSVGSSEYKDQQANSDSFDDEGLRCKLICSEDDMESSTRIRSLKGPYRNSVEVILRWSFDDVIYACAHLQNDELAQKLIVQMQKLGLEPSSCTYNSLAKAIISVGRIGDAIELLKEMESKNLKPNDSTLSLLSINCSKALDLDLAESLLNQIAASHNALPYIAFLQACEAMNQPERAVKMYAKMRKLKFKPDIRIYELLFSLFGNVNFPYEEGNLLSHAEATKRINAIEIDMLHNGIDHSKRSTINLLKALGSEGMVQQLLQYLHRVESKFFSHILDTDIFNAVLHSLVEAKENHKAIEMFRNMKVYGVLPDAATYNILIDCCSNMRCYTSACVLLSMMIRDGYPIQTSTYTVLIKVHLEYEDFPETLELLDRAISEVEKPDVLLFNTILRKACYRERIDVVETVLHAMYQQNIQPDVPTCSYVFSAYARCEFHNIAVEALQVLSMQMISHDLDTLEDIRRRYEHLILSENEEAEIRIMQIIQDSLELGAALLTLRWCSILGSSISWVPDQSPWAKRISTLSSNE
ncbi:pentatricopeptide repeat-containing protein At1g76280 [Amaranthus tricolor]|uniref:pentatricopeptide repeat-containing protein At1g76280 n=1 Tax=Amaranthus tricolor TaxID=29722 RepID=UPI00258EB3F1|nr:pentatricopeptide repeat-containing protein At1g76280 [Amaranthus tricolor]